MTKIQNWRRVLARLLGVHAGERPESREEAK